MSFLKRIDKKSQQKFQSNTISYPRFYTRNLNQSNFTHYLHKFTYSVLNTQHQITFALFLKMDTLKLNLQILRIMKHGFKIETGVIRVIQQSAFPCWSHPPYNSHPSSPSDTLTTTFFHHLLHFPAPRHLLPSEHCFLALAKGRTIGPSVGLSNNE